MSTPQQKLIHDIGNMLSIAQANVEGMLDEVVPTTQERLEGVREALVSARAMLEQWRKL